MYVGDSRFWLRAQGDGTVAAPGHLEHLVPWFGGSAEMVRVLLRAGARLRVSKAQPDSWRCPATRRTLWSISILLDASRCAGGTCGWQTRA